MKNYKLKIVCLLCLVTAAMSGCKKNELAIQKTLTNNHNTFAFAGDKKYHVLGYGYDVTGRLANSESAKLPVLNIEKFVAENPGLYLQNDDVNDYFDYSYGESIQSYSDKLTQKYKMSLDLNFLKVVKLFKGEINASFAKKDSASSKYVYASVRKMIKQKSLRIFYNTENLIDNYLTEQFKSDLASLPVAILVQRYGTHVLTDIELGARFDINYEAQTNSSKREEAAAAGASLSAGKVFNVTADIKTNSVEASSNFNQKLYYNSVGGDGTKGLIGELPLDNSTVKISIGNWQSSSNKDNAALIKIGENGLISLVDLISNPVKKAEVKSYIEQYLKAQGFRELGDVPVYVYYSSIGGDHYFGLSNQPTIGDNGYFKNEGIAFYAFSKPTDGAVPVYVYYNSNSADHYYSLGNQPTTGNGTFKNEGIAFYAYPKNTPNTAPVYMYYSSKDSDHYMGTGNQPTIGNGAFVNEGAVFNVPL